MSSAKRNAFRLSSKRCSTCEDLRQLNARSEAALREAKPQHGCREDDRLFGSAESRGRIEADFSCAQVDLLRSSRSSDQSTLSDARCLLGGLTVRKGVMK
jgi:hypothetical protein